MRVGCDHTRRLTLKWLANRKIPPDAVLEWLDGRTLKAHLEDGGGRGRAGEVGGQLQWSADPVGAHAVGYTHRDAAGGRT